MSDQPTRSEALHDVMHATDHEFEQCPPNDQLAQLATGSLIESRADKLFTHVNQCKRCQKLIDQILGQQKPLLPTRDGAKQWQTAANGDDAALSKLIRKAQQTGNIQREEKVDDARSLPKIVSVDRFVHGLRRSGLMMEDEFEKFLSDHGWESEDSDSNGETNSLAKLLVEKQKITAFQAKLLLVGRWQGLVLGNYEVLERLGRGGMGSVFKARHRRMGRTVCLKVVNSTGRQSKTVIERFRHEVRTLAALDHPNIVVAHDANESKGVPYLVMEYVDGEDLAKKVRSDGPLSFEDTWDVMFHVAYALRYAHREGVIHRDIKPHNLIAKRDLKTQLMSVKVLDLGLARFDTLLSESDDSSVLAAMTQTGVVIGTVDYMSPEQALDSREADARSDIYSLGCTIHFLLTGKPPFRRETVMQRIIAHREEPTPSLLDESIEGVTPEFNAVVEKMMAKDPCDRYQTVEELLEDLRAISEGEPLIGAKPNQFAEEKTEIRPRVRRGVAFERFVRSAISAALFLGLLGCAFWLGRSTTGIPILDSIRFPIVRETSDKLGAPKLKSIRNGGNGNALLIVSSNRFHDEEYKQLTKALEKNDIQFTVASPNYGTQEKDYGSNLKKKHQESICST